MRVGPDEQIALGDGNARARDVLHRRAHLRVMQQLELLARFHDKNVTQMVHEIDFPIPRGRRRLELLPIDRAIIGNRLAVNYLTGLRLDAVQNPRPAT